jgi:putative nucleotidyltransferase with HDIG domain
MAEVSASGAIPERLEVLVVDDNAALLRFLVSAFSANGCRVKHAAAAEAALTLLGQQSFDLVVSDITMPGLSGFDLLRAVKRRHPGTPVVLITGNPSVKSAVFGLRHGAYDYLPKPFSIREIQEMLSRVRADRQKWNGQLPLPAGLSEELSRRQSSIEVMSRIGDLAQQGLKMSAFMEQVLRLIAQSIENDCSLVLLRDEEGAFSYSHQGAGGLVTRVLESLQSGFADIVAADVRETVSISGPGDGLDTIAAVIPGIGQRTGILCLAREIARGGFLPDERAMVAGYAQTAALGLQNRIPRQIVEGNLVATITAFVKAIESKDRYLKGHSARVALYAVEVARALDMTTDLAEVVRRGAMLHDLGKLSLMDAILRTPDRLTAEDLTIIKSHPLVGAKILQSLRFLAGEARVVRHHHERFDGTGYPNRLKGEDIPLAARVVTVADVFDAMRSNRPYRTALTAVEAREEISRGCGSHFDPAVVGAFLRIPLDRLEDIQQHHEISSSRGATGTPALAETN